MITNQRQYRIAKGQLARFEEALTQIKPDYWSSMPDTIWQAMRDQYSSQIEELQDDIASYERIYRSGALNLDLEGLERLPEALIMARIAQGFTQKDLAKLLSVPEQQVQRDEATYYSGASFERLLSTARTLGVKWSAHASIERPTEQTRAPATSAEPRGTQQEKATGYARADKLEQGNL